MNLSGAYFYWSFQVFFFFRISFFLYPYHSGLSRLLVCLLFVNQSSQFPDPMADQSQPETHD